MIDPAAGAPEPVLAIEPAPVTVRRVLVLKLDHRGDFIMAQPAFAALRAAFPAALITLACGAWNLAEAEATGLFDRVLGSAFFPEDARAESRVVGDAASRLAFARLVAGEPYDLAIDLRLHDDTRPLLQLADATVRAGFGDFPFLDIALPFSAVEQGRSLVLRLPPERFGAAAGARDPFGIVLPGGALPPGEVLVHGPYETLEPGDWEVAVDIVPLRAPFEIGFDVIAEAGALRLGTGVLAVPAAGGMRYALHVGEPAREVEFRLRAGPSGTVAPFRFQGVAARRRGAFTGPHQAEMQYLLCCLAGLRLRHFWRIAEAAG